LTALNALARAFLRCIEDQADQKQCEQRMQDERAERASREPLGIPAIAFVAKFHAVVWNALIVR
jgi:hypothetical protein